MSCSTPMDVVFLGHRLHGLDDGFEYRHFEGTQFQDASDPGPHSDEYGRDIIRLGRDVTLPFTIHCFGHSMTFTEVGQQADGMYELERIESGRFVLKRIDSPHLHST